MTPVAGGAARRSGGESCDDSEKRQNERQDESADGALAVEKFEAEVGERQQPAEQRHGAGEVVVGNGVQAASAFE